MAKLTITIDHAVCMGSGLCVAGAPDLFELCSDGRSVLSRRPAAADRWKAHEAVETCPTSAIRVASDDGARGRTARGWRSMGAGADDGYRRA